MNRPSVSMHVIVREGRNGPFGIGTVVIANAPDGLSRPRAVEKRFSGAVCVAVSL
jgi:hypothetical protein